MSSGDPIEMDDVRFSAARNELTISAKTQRFQADGERQQLTVRLFADETHELVSLLSTVLAQEFNTRQAFRVPVRESLGVKVKIVDGRNSFDAEAKSVSMTGVFVKLADGPKPLIDIGQHFEVQIEFESHVVRIDAVVKRILDTGIGLFFPGCMQDEELEPPEELAALVIAVQRKWIQSKLV